MAKVLLSWCTFFEVISLESLPPLYVVWGYSLASVQVYGAFEKVDVHCKCLQGFTGIHSFFLQHLGKKALKRITEEDPYSSTGKSVHAVGKSCNI